MQSSVMKHLLLAMLLLLSIVHATTPSTSENATASPVTSAPSMSPTLTACETYQNNRQCKRDQACGWRGRRKCVLTCKYMHQAACLKDSRCEWNKPKAKRGRGHCRIADDDVRRRLEDLDEQEGYDFVADEIDN